MEIILENNNWGDWEWNYGSLDLFSIRWYFKKDLAFNYISLALFGIEFSIIWKVNKNK